MKNLLLFLLAFLSGSIPFSHILGKVFFKIDIRDFGEDKNPGPTNSFHAGGFALGFPSLLLDYLKGAAPIYIIITSFKLTPLAFVLISIAPLLGNIFTPFLKFKGGKGTTTSFGIWTTLTLWEVPTFLGIIFLIFLYLRKVFKEKITDKLIVLISMILLVIFVPLRYKDARLFAIAIINSMLLFFVQYKERIFK